MSDTPTPSVTENAARNARFAFPMLLGVVFLDAVGFGIIMPVTPALIIELTGVSLSEAAVLGAGSWFFTPPSPSFSHPSLAI